MRKDTQNSWNRNGVVGKFKEFILWKSNQNLMPLAFSVFLTPFLCMCVWFWFIAPKRWRERERCRGRGQEIVASGIDLRLKEKQNIFDS